MSAQPRADEHPVTPLLVMAPPRLDEWLVVNDNVMGGRSDGGLHIDAGQLVFSGSLNTDGGGFASIRSLSLDVALAPFEGIALRVRGDGRTYACDLRDAPTVRGSGVTWKAFFETKPGVLAETRLPFALFEPTWRGMSLRGKGQPLPSQFHLATRSVGFTIADRRDGPFRLEVRAIGAY